MTRPISDIDLVDPAPDLVRPLSLTVDVRHDDATSRHLVRTAQLLYTFWDRGDVGYLRQAVDASFVRCDCCS